MFKDPIALRMSPFGPSLAVSTATRTRLAFLTDLDRMPLRLDQCAESLRPLFAHFAALVENAVGASLSAAIARFNELPTIVSRCSRLAQF